MVPAHLGPWSPFQASLHGSDMSFSVLTDRGSTQSNAFCWRTGHFADKIKSGERPWCDLTFWPAVQCSRVTFLIMAQHAGGRVQTLTFHRKLLISARQFSGMKTDLTRALQRKGIPASLFSGNSLGRKGHHREPSGAEGQACAYVQQPRMGPACRALPGALSGLNR